MNSGYSNERELANAIASAKAKKKTGMNSGYANERELARAIAAAQAKQIAERTAQERARAKKAQEAYKDRTSPSNMTPAQKAAFLAQQGMSNY
jgi:hypothetical protein